MALIRNVNVDLHCSFRRDILIAVIRIMSEPKLTTNDKNEVTGIIERTKPNIESAGAMHTALTHWDLERLAAIEKLATHNPTIPAPTEALTLRSRRSIRPTNPKQPARARFIVA